MDYAPALVQAAELLQAPVATSVSGKGVIPENHPLAVGWGYGPQGTRTAEEVFKEVDLVLAIGVRYSEVSTAFYSIPRHHHLIHVDINPDNLGRIVQARGLRPRRRRPVPGPPAASTPTWCAGRPTRKLVGQIAHLKREEHRKNCEVYAKCGADPMAFLLALRRCLARTPWCSWT